MFLSFQTIAHINCGTILPSTVLNVEFTCIHPRVTAQLQKILTKLFQYWQGEGCHWNRNLKIIFHGKWLWHNIMRMIVDRGLVEATGVAFTNLVFVGFLRNFGNQ